MSEYLPYLVSIICATVSAVASISVCLIQINRNKKETKEQIEAEKEKIQQDYDNKIKLLREEYALKTGSQIVTDVVNKTVTSVYESPAVKNEINKKAQQALIKNRGKKNQRRS